MFLTPEIQLREISDANKYLAPISEFDRACRYPYHAPEGGFVLASGRLLRLEQEQLNRLDDDPHSGILAGRTPVLSVGSNRAPLQLLRKFGLDALLPVTPARLHDCDVTHAALLGYYAAVPCTAFPSSGTVVDLNVVWLDDDQLAEMHRTEGIGVAYDFVKMETVEHQFAVRSGPVFGYTARAGVLDCGNGKPASLAAIPAKGRKFKMFNQAEANAKLRHLAGVDDDRSMLQFIAEMQSDKLARDVIIKRLRPHAIQPSKPPWQQQVVNIDGFDAYL